MVSGCCKGQSQQSWDDLLRSKTELEKGASFENHAIHYLQNSCSTTAHSDHSMDWPSLHEFSIRIIKLLAWEQTETERTANLIPISSVNKPEMQRDTHVYMSVSSSYRWFIKAHHGKIVPQSLVLYAGNDTILFNWKRPFVDN